MDTLTTALRILARDIDSQDGVAHTVIGQAADEIERLRDRLEELRSAADQADVAYRAEIELLRGYRDEAEASAAIASLAAARLRLTDAERVAIQRLIEDYEQEGEPASADVVATLRGLLERTK